MAKIVFQTDEWGGVSGSHHIEFQVNGRTLMVQVNNDVVHVIGPLFEETDNNSCNAWWGLLPGSNLDSLHEYHEAVDAGTLRKSVQPKAQ